MKLTRDMRPARCHLHAALAPPAWLSPLPQHPSLFFSGRLQTILAKAQGGLWRGSGGRAGCEHLLSTKGAWFCSVRRLEKQPEGPAGAETQGVPGKGCSNHGSQEQERGAPCPRTRL